MDRMEFSWIEFGGVSTKECVLLASEGMRHGGGMVVVAEREAGEDLALTRLGEDGCRQISRD